MSDRWPLCSSASGVRRMSTAHYIPSPCIRRCTLDDQDICVGCGRSLNEIKRWSQADAWEQEQIVSDAAKRLAKSPRL